MLLGLFLCFVLLLLLVVHFSIELELCFDGAQLEYKLWFKLGSMAVLIPKRLISALGKLTKIRERLGNFNLDSFEEAKKGWRRMLLALDSLFQKFEIFHLEVQLSLGDPQPTVISCGGIWSCLGIVLPVLRSQNRLVNEPLVVVQPDFGPSVFKLYLHCIFHLQFGQIIFNQLKRLTYAVKGVE